MSRRHVLDLDDWEPDEIRLVLDGARRMRALLDQPGARLESLRGQVLVNLFYENSTRTRVSFELAAKRLGADVTNVTASASSVTKGESLIDTVRTLQALGGTIIVLRHSSSGVPDLVARHFQGHVVNAGDGWHAHPTQALLDAYTLQSRIGQVSGRRVVILGDILHSRVARSNVWSLTALGAQVVLCGPPTLLPPGAVELYRRTPGAGNRGGAAGHGGNQCAAGACGSGRGDGAPPATRAAASRPAADTTRIYLAVWTHSRPARGGKVGRTRVAPRPNERRG